MRSEGSRRCRGRGHPGLARLSFTRSFAPTTAPASALAFIPAFALLLAGLTAGAVIADETSQVPEPTNRETATVASSTPGVLVDAPGKALVSAHCGACHSLSLVTQNRGNADHWIKLIRWMQADHNLWDLGAAEKDIVDYLATHYGAPDLSPRRAPLDTTWRDAGD